MKCFTTPDVSVLADEVTAHDFPDIVSEIVMTEDVSNEPSFMENSGIEKEAERINDEEALAHIVEELPMEVSEMCRTLVYRADSCREGCRSMGEGRSGSVWTVIF